ncbi:hypothetical protein M7I_0673 [Glarea lozoyensis 74030]|uniref:Uncharacterized protein n=1 Tax=Glarea lozoyensis (strain ATCC 74030 / MF5533) TaxID=1104152 RepID=H0EE05_GLAL7|nr:hypothetical protein M7I_0673 [Glarea lozoyensis 74030]
MSLVHSGRHIPKGQTTKTEHYLLMLRSNGQLPIITNIVAKQSSADKINLLEP